MMHGQEDIFCLMFSQRDGEGSCVNDPIQNRFNLTKLTFCAQFFLKDIMSLRGITSSSDNG
jgi:hypothetical protein